MRFSQKGITQNPPYHFTLVGQQVGIPSNNLIQPRKTPRVVFTFNTKSSITISRIEVLTKTYMYRHKFVSQFHLPVLSGTAKT